MAAFATARQKDRITPVAVTPTNNGIGGAIASLTPDGFAALAARRAANPGTPVTPSGQAVAAPAPTSTPAAAGFDSAGQYHPQDDSVVHALDSITAANSPTMQRAAGIGMAVANARGLQNSSIAAQSAQKSMLDAAVPLASQQAQQSYGKNMQFQQGMTQKDLQGMQDKTQLTVAQLQADTSKQLAQLDAENRKVLQQMQDETTLSAQQMSTAAASQAAFSQALIAASSSYSSAISTIMSNPDLSQAARQSALDAAAAQRNSDYAMIQNIYGVSVSGSGTGTPTTGTGSGTTPPTGSVSWPSTPPAPTAVPNPSNDGIPHNDGQHTVNGQVAS